MITDIQNNARQLSFRRVLLGLLSAPFIVVGFAAGLLVVMLKWIIASLQVGYARAQRLLTNVAR